MARRSPGYRGRELRCHLMTIISSYTATTSAPPDHNPIEEFPPQRHRGTEKVSISQFPTRPLEPVSPRLCASVVRIAVFQTAARRHITAKRLTAISKPQNIVHPTTQIPKTPNHDRQKENTKPLTVTPQSTADIRIHIRQSTRQATNLRPIGQPLGHQHNLLSPVRFQSHTLPAKPSVQRGRRPGIKP
jgi:hypothetical protein